jgi:predicted ATPase/DNA-binding winged helix-turn-helix (wHTH) protein
MHLDEYLPPGEDIVGFGPFQLNRTKRVLTKGGSPIAVGSRAMEILLALTEKAGAILSHRELLRRVWPNIIVEDGTVRVHVALLRKVLRQAEPNSDYVHNVTGRGYSFVAPITRQRRAAEPSGMHSANSTVLKLPLRVPLRRNNLPHLITSVIGREKTTRALAERVTRERFVTVTGPGGSGKTVVAIVAANSLAPAHANGVCFVDLAAVKRPQEFWSLLATALGLSLAEADPLPEILASLSRQSMLMVLDNCEHVVDIASHLVESVLQSCPQVNILATSREPLRASGELVYELMPLELPAALDRVSRKDLLEHPAIHLFVERAGTYAGTPLNDEELWLVADVCRRSAGNPLAIEIAAGQVRWLGLKALSTGLQDAMYLSIEGRRTAERRHRTLRASFDWSYGLLSGDEQAVFRRLSVFAGSFNPDRAAAVIADQRLTHRIVLECLISLARKSLIIANATHQEILYRLDDLSRAYAAEKLHHAQEFPFTHRRHSQMWGRVGVEQIHAHARLWRYAQH